MTDIPVITILEELQIVKRELKNAIEASEMRLALKMEEQTSSFQ